MGQEGLGPGQPSIQAPRAVHPTLSASFGTPQPAMSPKHACGRPQSRTGGAGESQVKGKPQSRACGHASTFQNQGEGDRSRNQMSLRAPQFTLGLQRKRPGHLSSQDFVGRLAVRRRSGQSWQSLFPTASSPLPLPQPMEWGKPLEGGPCGGEGRRPGGQGPVFQF